MYKRSILLCLVVAALTSCGFRPLYDNRKQDNPSHAALQSIYVRPIEDQLGVMLRNELLTQFEDKSTNTNPQYELSVVMTESTQSLGVSKDATATRANLVLNARFILKICCSERDEEGALYGGSVISKNSYNLLTETYATVEARQDARRRGVRELAQAIRTKLAIYFLRRADDDGQGQSQRR